MQGNLSEMKPRSFKPMSVPGLPNTARETVNTALKAMSTSATKCANQWQKSWVDSMAFWGNTGKPH